MRSLFAAVAAIALVPASANAAEFVNGSFEGGTFTSSFITVPGGNSTTINGWVVTGNSVDYIGSYWAAQAGSQSIDLNGNGQGGIQQTFDTVVGQLYNVSFWLAGNTAGQPTVKSVQVGATGADSSIFTFDTTGLSLPNNMGWKNYNYQFTAGPGPSTTLSFASLNPGSFGAALDNVAVSAIPEPGTWAMMLLGIGLIGGAMRRRATAQSSNRLVKA